MIVQTVTSVHQFRQAFQDMGRIDQFSYDGLEALYEFLEDMSEDIGEPCELDVIAICCDFSEETFYDIAASYWLETPDDYEDLQNAVLEFLEENTTVVYHDDKKVLFQDF